MNTFTTTVKKFSLIILFVIALKFYTNTTTQTTIIKERIKHSAIAEI